MREEKTEQEIIPVAMGGSEEKNRKFLDTFDHIHRKNVMIENLGLC